MSGKIKWQSFQEKKIELRLLIWEIYDQTGTYKALVLYVIFWTASHEQLHNLVQR